MDDPTRVSRLLLGSATTLAKASSARAIIVAVDALPELEAVPPRTILVARDKADVERIEKLTGSDGASINVPNVELDRLGQVKLAAIIALSHRVIDLDDTVVFLTGPFRSLIDSLVVMPLGSEYELFDTTRQPDIDEHIKRAVFHRVLSLALQLGQHGREGKKVGSLLVVGDHRHVLEQSEQMILNPFKGYTEKERNILDDKMTETVKEFSTLDGAFIIHGTGVIETAGARLKAGLSEGLPSGLGARHAAAAGITLSTRSIAITVSQSDGTVRVWRAGKMVASFEPTRR
ncbi:MAG: DNA integrity scanning protein DisA nucleotide-binding domain protein [Phycisphaerales bacterium]|nr:MAG: DNA integrity scanning protein DisA nucleotide-binding domain protein [Phycisphaerales bacterium]